MTEGDERFHLAALIDGLGRAAAGRAMAAAGSAGAALARSSVPRTLPARLERQCTQAGIRLLVRDDADFPPLLREIPDAPHVIYARGNAGALLRPSVAMVGARRCTRGGAEAAAALARALAAEGLCIVSGLARGIDTAAHRGAVAEGSSVAVIGSGLARPYPRANRGLADAIVDAGGLLLSEYPPWRSARRHYFPERNRLISGTSLAVVVVEAGEQSGSLITARLAAEQGRDVGAVPGPVASPVSRGCHRLIKQGAALVESPDDVLELLGLSRPGGAAEGGDARPEDTALAVMLAAVSGTVTTLDEILAVTGTTAPEASAALVELELCGFVRQVPGGYIRRPSR